MGHCHVWDWHRHYPYCVQVSAVFNNVAIVVSCKDAKVIETLVRGVIYFKHVIDLVECFSALNAELLAVLIKPLVCHF